MNKDKLRLAAIIGTALLIIFFGFITLSGGSDSSDNNSQAESLNLNQDIASSDDSEPQSGDNNNDGGTSSEARTTSEHPVLGYTVKSPSGWDTKQTESDVEGYYSVITFLSPNFLNEPDASYPVLEKGAEISILASDANGEPVKPQEFVDDKDKFPGVYNQDSQIIKLDGVNAAQYIWANEGSPQLRIMTHKDDVNYQINLTIAHDGYDNLENQFDPYIDNLNQVLKTFKFGS